MFRFFILTHDATFERLECNLGGREMMREKRHNFYQWVAPIFFLDEM